MHSPRVPLQPSELGGNKFLLLKPLSLLYFVKAVLISNSPNDSTISLLGVYPKGTERGTQTDWCTPKFIAALFIIARRWTQLEGPTGDRTKWGPSIQMEYYSSGGSVVKNLPANTEDASSILESRRSLEKEMATHSNILAWKIPWTEEPGVLQSMGSQKNLTWLSD